MTLDHLYPMALHQPRFVDANESNGDDGSITDDSALYGEALDEYDELRPGVCHFGLGRGYVGNWSCQEAFREFVQNWYKGRPQLAALVY